MIAAVPPAAPSHGSSAITPPRSAGILLGLAAAVIALAGLRAASGVIGPVFLAIVLVLAVEPIRSAATRRHGLRVVAVASVLVPAYAILLAFVGALVLSVGQLVAMLPAYSSRFQAAAGDLAGALEPLGISRAQVGELIGGIDPSAIAGGLGSLLGGATNAASAVLLIVALILFLAIDRAAIERRLERPTVAAGLAPALRLFVARTQRFLIVSSVFGLIVAVLDVAALGLLGVPAPWVWGLLSFVTNYVPNVGFVLGLGPPAVIALLEGGPGSLIGVVIAYSVINFTIQFLIQPKIVGDAVGLSATVTLLSFVFWALVMGPVGGLLAVPLTLLVKAVFVDADPAARWLGPWLGDADGVITEWHASEFARVPAGRSHSTEVHAMRVLLALDGSPSSLVARDLVARLPWPAGTVIRLLTVNEVPATAMVGLPGVVLDPGIVTSLAARTAEELARLGDPLRADGRTIETSVLEGRAASAIVGAAGEWTADVVVLGSRGRGPLSTMVLGSVSAEVVERCETAVLVARGATVSRLLVATDGSADAAAIPDDLARWGIFRGLHADVISVVPPREPGFDLLVDLYTLGSYERPAGAREALVEHHRALAAAAGDRLGATGIDTAVELAEGDPADQILAAATRLHTDLIVTGSRRLHGLDRVLLGSVARNVVFHAHASVLVMGRARSSALPDPGVDARRT